MTKRELALALIVGLNITAILIAFVFATGGTFGQRCQKIYPNNPLEYERCVNKLSRGVVP